MAFSRARSNRIGPHGALVQLFDRKAAWSACANGQHFFLFGAKVAIGYCGRPSASSNRPIMSLVGLTGRPLSLNKRAISASSHSQSIAPASFVLHVDDLSDPRPEQIALAGRLRLLWLHRSLRSDHGIAARDSRELQNEKPPSELEIDSRPLTSLISPPAGTATPSISSCFPKA